MFKPKRVIFEKGSLDTEVGSNIYQMIKNQQNIEIITASSNRIKSHIPGDNLYDQYRSGKETLVVGERKSLKFQSCKPSAHYQLPLVSGCMGRCEYCYLNTQLGDKPYIRVFTNIDEILAKAKQYMTERLPDITIFEGAATSDPIPVEPYTHALRKTIEFIGKEEHAKFRFVTKYTDVDSLLNAEHNNHTEIRFSINTPTVIHTYEHVTASASKRIEAAAKVASAGYQLGFIIAPVFLYEDWEKEYRQLLLDLHDALSKECLQKEILFEVISHRYTTTAKNRILEIYPDTTLPMLEDERTFKYGQFGYGKYVYTKEQLAHMKAFFQNEINDVFPHSVIKYII